MEGAGRKSEAQRLLNRDEDSLLLEELLEACAVTARASVFLDRSEERFCCEERDLTALSAEDCCCSAALGGVVVEMFLCSDNRVFATCTKSVIPERADCHLPVSTLKSANCHSPRSVFTSACSSSGAMYSKTHCWHSRSRRLIIRSSASYQLT